MRIQVLSLSKSAQALSAFVERRVRLAMRRRPESVPTVTVRLEDINGPRGGPDKQCRVELRTVRHGTVVAQAVATTWRGALSAALTRATHVLFRLLQRKQERSRSPLPAIGTQGG